MQTSLDAPAVASLPKALCPPSLGCPAFALALDGRPCLLLLSCRDSSLLLAVRSTVPLPWLRDAFELVIRPSKLRSRLAGGPADGPPRVMLREMLRESTPCRSIGTEGLRLCRRTQTARRTRRGGGRSLDVRSMVHAYNGDRGRCCCGNSLATSGSAHSQPLGMPYPIPQQPCQWCMKRTGPPARTLALCRDGTRKPLEPAGTLRNRVAESQRANRSWTPVGKCTRTHRVHHVHQYQQHQHCEGTLRQQPPR